MAGMRYVNCGVRIDSLNEIYFNSRRFAAGTQHLNLQSLGNAAVCRTGNSPRLTQIRDLHMAFRIFYVCDLVMKPCRKKKKADENLKVRITGQNEAVHTVCTLLEVNFPPCLQYELNKIDVFLQLSAFAYRRLA